MTGLSAAGEAAVLAPITTGISAWISLHTSDPGPTGILNEVSGNGYSRVNVTGWVNTGTNPTVAQNSAVITFNPANPGGWGTITFFGLWTLATAGVFMGAGAMGTPKPINANDTARFAAGALTITAD